MTIPRSGYDPVLAALMLHDLDVRHPLGISRAVPEDRPWVAFNHLTKQPSPGFTMRSRLRGLRLVATTPATTDGTDGGSYDEPGGAGRTDRRWAMASRSPRAQRCGAAVSPNW
jgi:hypothetical protein